MQAISPPKHHERIAHILRLQGVQCCLHAVLEPSCTFSTDPGVLQVGWGWSYVELYVAWCTLVHQGSTSAAPSEGGARVLTGAAKAARAEGAAGALGGTTRALHGSGLSTLRTRHRMLWKSHKQLLPALHNCASCCGEHSSRATATACTGQAPSPLTQLTRATPTTCNITLSIHAKPLFASYSLKVTGCPAQLQPGPQPQPPGPTLQGQDQLQSRPNITTATPATHRACGSRR